MQTFPNALGALVSSGTEGRVDELRLAEVAARDDGVLPRPFDDKPEIKEWLLLKPELGERDLRPLLHLSRDTATRDFGADDMTTEGRALRDALLVASGGNAQLTQAIQAAGAIQAERAMVKVWQLKSPKRTWRSGDEITCLLEPCKVFPELGAKAGSLLAQAPHAEVGPGLIPLLYEQSWTHAVLHAWGESATTIQSVKNVINQRKKKS